MLVRTSPNSHPQRRFGTQVLAPMFNDHCHEVTCYCTIAAIHLTDLTWNRLHVSPRAISTRRRASGWRTCGGTPRARRRLSAGWATCRLLGPARQPPSRAAARSSPPESDQPAARRSRWTMTGTEMRAVKNPVTRWLIWLLVISRVLHTGIPTLSI